MRKIEQHIEYNLTEREIEVLKALQMLGYDWLVRDKDGELFVSVYKPEKLNTVWTAGGTFTTPIDEDLFTFIKWEDEEPVSIKGLLR